MFFKRDFTKFCICSIIYSISLNFSLLKNQFVEAASSGQFQARDTVPSLNLIITDSNKKCADLFLHNETEPAITLYDKSLVNRTQFDYIRKEKLQNASYSVSFNGDDAHGCRLEICGFSIERDEWGECTKYKNSGTVSKKIYVLDYEVTSISCYCYEEKVQQVLCDTVNCTEKNQSLTWQGKECARLYLEEKCQSCFAKPFVLQNNTQFNTSNSFQVFSAIVRPACQLWRSYNGFHYWDNEPEFDTITDVKDKLTLTFHKDSENFHCLCLPENLDLEGSDDHVSSKFPVEVIIALVLVLIIIFVIVISVIWNARRKKQETAHPQPTTRRLDYVMDELVSDVRKIKQAMDIPVDNFEQTNSVNADARDNEADINTETEMSNEFLEFKELFNECMLTDFEVNVEDIVISKQNLANPLGTGQFGIVYKGHVVHQDDGLQKDVAVKKIKWKGVHETVVDSFLREVKIFGLINKGHPNIVQFYGACCHPGGLYLLTEYCTGGSLRDFLLTELRPKYQNTVGPAEKFVAVGTAYFEVTQEKTTETCEKSMEIEDLLLLLGWCKQIADGLEFLCENGILHVDMAARNVLLSQKRQVKICDFGLSRKCLNEQSAAESLVSGSFPLNSYAPECASGQFEGYATLPLQVTKYVDVWAYGCTVWEIFTLGNSLYPDVPEQGVERILKIRELLIAGYRNPKPELAPDYVYEKLLECWNQIPRERPSFTDISAFFLQKTDDDAGYVEMR